MKGALSLSILREMRLRGFDVTLAYFYPEAVGYTWDECADFSADDRLVNMTDAPGVYGVERLSRVIRERDISLALQIGAPQAYSQIARVREQHPELHVLDILYNPVGHTVAHFLFEGAFDGVIVESEAMRQFMLQNTAKTEPMVHVLISGIDLDVFKPRSPAAASQDLVVGYVGRMSPEKDPLRFVSLAEAVHARLPDVRFQMYGEGAMADEVRARVAAGSAPAAIDFRGYVPHVRDALHAVDVLVVPSKVDGRPNVVMEANACGIPVLGTRVGGIPELIEHGANGFLLSDDAEAQVADLVRGWIAEPSSLVNLKRRCRLVAEERFDRRKMMDAYARVFAVCGARG
ncbi:glycosyltransferase [Sabulicella rubraurantiaca]|uniref:glycosyltransferase n=1 Tax=Sabulicella rubraurantiaca TaxID=2811429 RepID=UPI001A977D29|nr:glycosyltransferase [Sabulicella rubraurantiaca]